MTYAAVSTREYATGISCSNCGDWLESQAKFCGSCGFIVAPDSFKLSEYPEQEARLLEFEQSRQYAPNSLPSFAIPIHSETASKNAATFNAEISNILFLLGRERFFLYAHIITFLLINFFGCWVAWKCYTEFIGDEMSKMMIASTPFLFINSIALVMIVPIKGTRAEIARLKEKLSYTRFKIEFGHLNL